MAPYGLVDDGFGGWEWSDTPTYGLDADWEWSTEYLYLLNESWEWVDINAPVLSPPYGSSMTVSSRRPVLTLSDA